MSTTQPKRRRDATAMASAIERAATTLVLEHGYDAVTVDMICELAGASHRTFYNHFTSKDAALLGTVAPSLDERAARAFIASTEPLLAGAARLIRVAPDSLAEDPEYLADRIRVIGTSPQLMARQLERIEALEAELREIIRLRLGVQHAAEEPGALDAQAALITHLVMGLMRSIGRSWAQRAERGALPDIAPEPIEQLLARVVAKLG